VNGNCRRHLRNAWLTACSAPVLALAGCGGDDNGGNQGPRIDGAAASELAAASDEVARLIDEGDVCGAAHRADELFADAQARIDAGSVPPELADQLLTNAEALRNEVNCELSPPPPPPPPPTTDEDEGDDDEGNGRGKKKGKDDKDD
jgi:hypothetical protein